MAIAKETIAIVWIGGIGLGALLSAAMLTSKRTQNWSERRIAFVSMAASLIAVGLLVMAI